jgi:hypothetical protein
VSPPFPGAFELHANNPQNTCTMSARASIAIFVPCFGGYDRCTPYDLPVGISGWYFVDHSTHLTDAHGWNVIRLDVNETPWVSAPRLAGKFVKFMAFTRYAIDASVVVFHDANLRITDFGALRAVAQQRNCTVLWKNWPHSSKKFYPSTSIWKRLVGIGTIAERDRLVWEMHDMLTRREGNTRRSRENVLKWRQRLQDEQRLYPTKYVEGNLFVVFDRPKALSAFSWIYNQCHYIERDQFLIPYVIDDRADMCVSNSLFTDLGMRSWGHTKPHSTFN